MGLRGPKPKPVADRYWSKVETTDVAECWRWLGSHRKDGRPQFFPGGDRVRGMVAAFRVGYELVFGPVPPDLDLDHLCNNAWCVNPNHCEPATPKQNRGRPEREKTHCPQGHAYDERNTYYRHNGRRQCRRCAADAGAERKARAAVAAGRIPGYRGRPWYLTKGT